MSKLWRVVSLSMLVFFLSTPLAQTSYAATPTQPIYGVLLVPPTVQLFGNVTLVDSTCYAVIKLRDSPDKSIVVKTSDQNVINILETALTTGNLVSVVGQNVSFSPTPRGGSWTLDVYNIDEVTLYNSK